MKVRESGMPDEAYWNSFFNVDAVLDKLFINAETYTTLQNSDAATARLQFRLHKEFMEQ